jgi:hypothetical protein
MLKDKLKKNIKVKKDKKATWVNLSNPQQRSWNWNNRIESKLKK